jgi:hypothetical protein
MAEDNEPFGEIGRAGQQATDSSSRAKRYSDRQGATGESVKFLKESADLQQKLVSLLADEAALIEQIKDGKKSLVDLAKLEEGKEDLILKSKQNQNILSGVGTMASKQQNRAMDSVLSSVNKIKGINEKDVGLNKVKNSLMGKAELNMKSLSGLTGGLAPKALNFVKALRANPMIMIASAVIGLMKMLISVNNEIAEIGRGLGVSANEARDVRANFAAIQGASSNVLNTTAEIAKAQGTLNLALGTSATMISGRILDGMATLQNRMQLTAESAVGFAQSAMLSGKSVTQLRDDAIGSALAVEKERGTRLDIRSILEETGKVTGQIRAQLGGSVEAIAEAVSKAKSLGMELKGVAAAGKQLLNFEQSISAELEAELLTGKQINLEKARLAALTGDYTTLAEEINANVGDFYEFSKLNVLQQESLAKAVGLEADALSDILMKKENIADLAEKARLEGKEDLAQNLEQLSVQQQFNAAIEKLKTAVINFVAQLESEGSFLFDWLGFTIEKGGTAAGSVGAGKEADIEGAVERGLSKAKINVATRYDSFNHNNPSYINGRIMSTAKNNNSFA